jgi:hypothetical protein
MQDVMHSFKGYPVGSGKVPACNTAVGLDIGGHGSNDVHGLLHFLGVEMPLVVGAFPGLNFVDYFVNRAF